MTDGSGNLIDRSRQQARENDRRLLAALVSAGDRGLTPGAAQTTAALPSATFTATMRRLAGRGLARRDGKRRVWATAAGIIEAGAGVPGVDLGPALAAAIGHFATEAHRAFARLLVSGIVARRLLHDHHDDGWPGFIAVGGTGEGKTALAGFAARAAGLDPNRAVRLLGRETPGSVFARRRQERGGTWKVERSPLMDLPFLALDEWDKAPEAVRQEAGALLLGSTRPDLEGSPVEVRPLVMVALNVRPDRLGDVLHEAFVRRSIVLHTGGLAGQCGDLDEAVRRLFRPGVIPRLQLPRLRLPVRELPDPDRAAMRAELRTALTPDGWRLCDVEGLSRLALGRAAILGEGADLRQAALATALDYLSTAATLEQARPGYAGQLGELLGRGALLPDVEAVAAEAGQRRQAELRDRETEISASLAFEHERELRAAELIAVRTRLGRPSDPEGKALVRALTTGASKLRGCRGQDAFNAARGAVRLYLEAGLRRAADREREQRQRVETKQRQREVARAASERRKRDRAAWMERRRVLAGFVPVRHTRFDPADGVLRQSLGSLRIPCPPGTDPRRVWLAAWRQANAQVAELGGRRTKQPAYREIKVPAPWEAAQKAIARAFGQKPRGAAIRSSRARGATGSRRPPRR